MTCSFIQEELTYAGDESGASINVGNLRTLTDAELLLVAGAGNPWGAVMGGLQGSVLGGVTNAAGAFAIGSPWAPAGDSGYQKNRPF